MSVFKQHFDTYVRKIGTAPNIALKTDSFEIAVAACELGKGLMPAPKATMINSSQLVPIEIPDDIYAVFENLNNIVICCPQRNKESLLVNWLADSITKIINQVSL